MYFVMTEPTTAARTIARTAQHEIREKTGLRMHLMTPAPDMTKSPQRMLHVIALALDMNPNAFKMKTRIRNIVEMRFLGALFLRQNYPTLTLQQIAKLFGGQDHTSIMNSIARAYSLIQAGDPSFVAKYNTVLKSVTTWLKREEFAYA